MPDRPPGALPGHLAETPIRLIVADIDGCLSAGTGHHFNHDLLQELAAANLASKSDITVPAITLCTGRPQPYVECLLQAIHGYRPALCEGGTLYFDLLSHSIITHPNFGESEEKQLAELRHMVDRRLVKKNIKPEPGKVTHVTLIVQPPNRPEELYEEALDIVSHFDDVFQVDLSRVCVHFLFKHIHKGVGVHWLAEDTGIPLEQMAGIGDAAPDLPFLQRVGFAYAPANAQDHVKEACHAISTQDDAGAASELLQMVIAHNRRLQNEGLLNNLEVHAL